ncbi:RDD family protein [Marinomonas agarivorans]|nr:RDD family protein [Marinomonas agarivorans]
MLERKVRLWRRLAAAFYDGLLLIACYFVITLIGIVINDGEAINGDILFWCLLVVTWSFFVKFWCYPGQTLGMQVWKVQVLDESGHHLTWRQSSIRFCIAILSWAALGTGFIWALFDKNGRTWHDKVSQSKLVFIDHKKRQQEQ